MYLYFILCTLCTLLLILHDMYVMYVCNTTCMYTCMSLCVYTYRSVYSIYIPGTGVSVWCTYSQLYAVQYVVIELRLSVGTHVI